jgi:hypothetical protein
MTDHDDIEPPHASSATDLVLNELQLFGYLPLDDQPDPRPLPEGKTIAGAVADIFDALVATLNDTRLEPDLPDLLWSTVNLFHRAADRIVDVGEAYERDGRGRPLPVWHGCRIIADGDVFVMNWQAEDSLDGRYFGPLPASAIIGRAVPVWTDEE